MLSSASLDQDVSNYFLSWKTFCEWITDKRAKALVVQRADIQAFTLAMAPQFELSPEEFKASQHWLYGFLQ